MQASNESIPEDFASHKQINLPKWEALCAHVQKDEADANFAAQVNHLKSKGPNWRFRTTQLITQLFLQDPCYKKFLKSSWDEVIDLMADQVARNKEATQAEAARLCAAPVSSRTNAQFFRTYAQMPCTDETARRRVAYARRFVERDQAILLLGDDDMVSIELARAGFTNVTALDIDDKVLDAIETTAQEENLQIKLVQQDLSQPLPLHLYGDYALVFFDPPYSLAGVQLFLGPALALTQHRPGTLFVLSLHLMSLLRQGLPGLQALLDKGGLEVCDFSQGFNTYPVPKRLKPLLHIVNRIVIGSNTLATEAYAFPYFLSDLLLLRKT